MRDNLHIRWLIRADINAITAMTPRLESFDLFYTLLRKKDHIGMVAEEGNTVHGYMIYQVTKKELQIKRFYVNPLFRRQRVGSEMIHKLISKKKSILAIVPIVNDGMQEFLRFHSFKCWQVFKEYTHMRFPSAVHRHSG